MKMQPNDLLPDDLIAKGRGEQDHTITNLQQLHYSNFLNYLDFCEESKG
jgi:hypothetical protein